MEFKRKEFKPTIVTSAQMNGITLFIVLIIAVYNITAQPLHYGGCWLQDTDGRYYNPKGFVVILEDKKGNIEYTLDDYKRMISCGANVQVVRIAIGQLAGLQGKEEQQNYIERIGQRVKLAAAVGMKTIFKMTIYGLKEFNNQWESIFTPDGEYRKHLFSAWKLIWDRYADDSMVLGYDFLNEPRREKGIAQREYEDVSVNSLIPLYKDLISEMAKISPNKWAIYQPLLIDDGDRGKISDGLDGLPMWHIQMPKVYDRMIYAPHGYFASSEMHMLAVNKHLEDAKASGSALMMGEWGRQTYIEQDTNLKAQLDYTRLYVEVSSIFDAAGMGLIKAWFAGTRDYNFHERRLTWNVYYDSTATGTAERKYIMDVICRPFPLYSAGCEITNYGFNYLNRTFRMDLVKNDYPKGITEIYIPEDRHYPDGFMVIYGNTVLVRDKTSKSGLSVLQSQWGVNSKSFVFDDTTQRLLISEWDLAEEKSTLKVIPGSKLYFIN